MISQSEFFDDLATRWDDLEREDIGTLLDRVVSLSDVAPGMDILDVGTGTGALIPSLLGATGNAGRVCAVDISQGMLRVARSKGFPESVEFILADVMDHDWPEESFDRVMCNAVFPHFTDKALALRRIHRMLRPEGLVVVSHPTGREAVNQIHRESGSVVADDRVPAPEQMRRLLEAAGFVDVSVIDEPEFYLARGAKPGGA